MKNFVIKNHRTLFYSTWFILGIIQSSYTELMDDEAYYWAYSRFPAFGYFEHPPLIALFTGAGYWLFKNELGVRFFIVILNTASIFIIRQLSESKNDFLYYAIVLSISITQLGGFIAAPDNVLIFFTALFFLAFKEFVVQMNLSNTLQLGVVMALMLYSKYHGILVIIFTLLPFPKIFLKYHIWMAVLLATVLFSPYLYWQFNNDFPTLKFHLFERNSADYRISFTIDYIYGQLLAAGPVIGWLLLWSASRYHPVSRLQKALKYAFTGIYLFFLLSSLNGTIETNWTVAAFIPLIVLSHQYLDQQTRLKKWLYISIPFTLIFVFAVRVAMIFDTTFSTLITRSEFHGNKTAAAKILDKAGELPLVMLNSYQKASKYWFYTGHTSFSLNTANYHRNSYNYWQIEDSLIGGAVYVIGLKDSLINEPLNLDGYPGISGGRINNYFSFSKIRFTNIENAEIKNGNLQISCSIKTPAAYLPLLHQAPYDTASVYIASYSGGIDTISYYKTDLKVNQITKEEMQTTLSCLPVQQYRQEKLRIVLSTCLPGWLSLNSDFFILHEQ